MPDSIRSFRGTKPSLGKNVYVDPKALVLGDVHLGDEVSIWPMAVIRGDVNYIKIGKFSNIQDGAVLHVTHDGPYTPGGRPLILGEGVTIGHHALLHACTIEDYCLIGMGAILLDAVHVQTQVMIGAGSLVTPGTVLQSGHLYFGNPAKLIRSLTVTELEQLKYSAEHYIRLKNQYLSES